MPRSNPACNAPRRRRQRPSSAPEPSAAAPTPAAAGALGSLADLPVAGLTRRRIALLIGALVAAWVIVLFARQVGEASEATARADAMRAANIQLVSESAGSRPSSTLIQRQAYIAQAAREYRLGEPREIPFVLADDAPPLAADAPGSAAVRLGNDAAALDAARRLGTAAVRRPRSGAIRPIGPGASDGNWRDVRSVLFLPDPEPYAGVSTPTHVTTGVPRRRPRRHTGRVGRPRMITIPVEDWVFGVAALVGGLLLLFTVVFDDILGGLLDGFGFDIGGTSITPILLGFIGMFGAGGLFATQVIDVHGAQAAIIGVLAGVGGAGLAGALFGLLRRSESEEPFTLSDLVGGNGLRRRRGAGRPLRQRAGQGRGPDARVLGHVGYGHRSGPHRRGDRRRRDGPHRSRCDHTRRRRRHHGRIRGDA